MSVEREFIARSTDFLLHEYLPKIRACFARLQEGDVWWRPNDASNAAGNLVLHLAGNVRQWIVCGVGGASDARHRAREFSARSGATKAEMLAQLEEVIQAAVETLQALDSDRLQEHRTIQGRDVSILEAIYHVVEHFAMHTGQIVWITKARTGCDLAFYDEAGGLAVPRWVGARPMRRSGD